MKTFSSISEPEVIELEYELPCLLEYTDDNNYVIFATAKSKDAIDGVVIYNGTSWGLSLGTHSTFNSLAFRPTTRVVTLSNK